MDILTYYSDNIADILHSSWEIVFHGDIIDDRGEHVCNILEGVAKESHKIKYLPKELQIVFDDNLFSVDSFDDELKWIKGKSIIIDSTTLGVAELLLLCQCLYNNNIYEYDVLYLEPKHYTKKSDNFSLKKRDFDLSQDVVGYISIPSHAISLEPEDYVQHVVFLCGYEAERINRAFEETKIIADNCCCIFGVPPFQSGWEMNSFANNLPVIINNNIPRQMHFAGATNPLSTFEKINEIYKAIEDEEQLFVVPVGTKPMALGACLFLVQSDRERVSILYDHPQRKPKRTEEFSRCHLYKIKMN